MDYIKRDKIEDVKKNLKNKLKKIQERNRGVSYTEYGKVEVNERKFAKYIVSRINLFRLDTNERYIENQETKGYETVSEVTIGKICMHIMDEYNDDYYFKYVKENRLVNYIDKYIPTYRKLIIDDKYILFPNGIYDIENFSFDSKFETETTLTFQMGFAYDPDAECPEWKKALKKMFPEDRESIISIIQEMFGYTFLYGKTPADTLFYLWGKGRNGKSIITNVLRLLHGVENIAGVPLADLNERYNLSAIYDKRVCICPENAKEKIKDTSTLKALTGRDLIKVEKKYEDPFTINIPTKIIVNSNHYLRTDDTSNGFWERILPIPFDVTFLNENELMKVKKSEYFCLRDVSLEDKLEKELPGIFNWSLEGLRRLQSNQWMFTYSEKVAMLKAEMMMYCKPVAAFVSQCVEQGNDNKENGKRDLVKSSLVRERFLEWAEKKSLNTFEFKDSRAFRQAFEESLKEHGIIARIGKKSVDYYYGIKLKEE